MLTQETEARLMNAITQIENSSLLKGDMGVCIFLFVKGRADGNQKLTEEAERILTRIAKVTGKNKDYDLTDGITGIGLGLSYLARNKYIEGDINDILADIDANVYKKFSLKTDFGGFTKMRLPLTDILMYYIKRYGETTSENMREPQRRVMRDLMNTIYAERDGMFYDEPYPFSLTKNRLCMFLYELATLYSMGMEQERIKLMLREMEYSLFSRRPALHANRLALAAATALAGKNTGLERWVTHAAELRSGISIDKIFNEEMPDKCIFLLNGLVGLWLTASFYNSVSDTVPVELDAEYLRQRIINSSAWDRMAYDSDYVCRHYSLDGYCGVKLFLDHLERLQK